MRWYFRHYRHRLAHLLRLNSGDAVLFKEGGNYRVAFRCECGQIGQSRTLTRPQALRLLCDYTGRWELGPAPARRANPTETS